MNQELIDYVKQQLKQGVSKDVIAKNLFSQGWNQKDLQESFLAIHNSDANASFIFGLISIFSISSPYLNLIIIVFDLTSLFNFVPLMSYILFNIVSAVSAGAGLSYGQRGLKSLKKWRAVAGIVFSLIAIVILLFSKWLVSQF